MKSKRIHSTKLALILGLTMVLTIGGVSAARAAGDGQLERFAKALAELRAEVESLSSEVDSRKQDQQNRMRSLASQKMDLELQVQREERRIKQLEAQAEKQREAVKTESESTKDLGPALDDSIAKLRSQVEASLPFKRGERLKALDEIEKQRAQGLISSQKATSRLWQFVEDEIRLTRENGLYRQTIVLDGEEMLVDVARVGMMALYFKTDDGRFGHTVKTSNGWKYKVIENPEGSEQIAGLFDAFRKNIRVGYFELPNALTMGGLQ